MGNMRLYLYRMSSQIAALLEEIPFSSSGFLRRWAVRGWSAPESWGTWTLGGQAELDIPRGELPAVADDQHIILSFRGKGLVTPTHARQRLEIYVNGAQVATHVIQHPNSDFDFDVVIPSPEDGAESAVHIGFKLPDAATPRSLGINNDNRMLALHFKSVTVKLVDAHDQTY